MIDSFPWLKAYLADAEQHFKETNSASARFQLKGVDSIEEVHELMAYCSALDYVCTYQYYADVPSYIVYLRPKAFLHRGKGR